MAVTQVDGAKIQAFLNNETYLYATSNDLTNSSGQKPEQTINGALVWSPGIGSSKYSGKAILESTHQATLQQLMARGSFVPLQVNVGASVYAAVGKITELSYSNSAGGSSETSVTWEGPLEEMMF